MKNKSIIPVIVISVLITTSISIAQSVIVKKSPLLDQVVREGTEIIKIADGFMFTEGPVWSEEGYLLFSDIPADKIMKWDPVNGVSVFLEHSGKSNGLMFDSGGSLILCQHDDRRIAKLNKDLSFETISDNWKGKKLNSPNDLAIKSDGSVYFTDPAWGLAKQENDPSKEIPFQGVFMHKDGETILLDSTLSSPNGIVFSPDEKWLYVANFDKKTQAKTWVKYKVNKKGYLQKRTLFADASESLEKGGPDGMKVDLNGNVYCTGPGGILIYSSAGEYLGLIRFPEIPANCCFGGEDGKTLFVTARTGLYSVQLESPGILMK